MLDIVGEQLVGGDDDRVVFQDRAAVLVRIDPVGRKIGRVVHRGDGEIHASGRGAALAVADDVVEIGRAPVIVLGRDGDQAVVADGHLDIGIRTDRLDHQRIAIDIGIVGGENARVDGKGAAFGNRGCAVVPCHRRIVDRGDLDEHLGFRAAAFGRVRDIAEFGRAVEVRVGREADVAVARQRGSAVLGAEDLAHDHAVAVEVVRQQAFNANDDIAVFLDRETGVVVGRGDRADTDFDCRRVEAVSAVGQRIAERDGSVIAANGGKAHISVGIERGDAVRSAVHRHDAQGIAVGVEVVGKQGRGADHQLLAGDDREGAIGLGIGCTVGETVADGVRGPGHAVGEGVQLYSATVGGERAGNGQAVVIIAREAEDDGIAAAREPLDRNIGRIDTVEVDDITAARRTVVDPVMAGTGAEAVIVRAAEADEQIIAGARGKRIGPIEAEDVVVAGGVAGVEHRAAHRCAVPGRAIGKLNRDRPAAAVGRSERADQRHPVARVGEGQDQVEIVGPAACDRCDIGNVVIRQDKRVGPACERFVAVIAIASLVDVAIRPEAAVAKIVARAAVDGIVPVGAEQDIVAARRLAFDQLGLDRGQVELGAIGKRDCLDAAACGEATDDGNLVVGPCKTDDKIVIAAAAEA